jgi:ribulose-phosphate 3-epimerase
MLRAQSQTELQPEVNLVLVMTINPGFGNQPFLNMTLPKTRQARQMIEQVNPSRELELDGGIYTTTAPLRVAAGGKVLVAGSAIFNHDDGVATGMKRLQVATLEADTN